MLFSSNIFIFVFLPVALLGYHLLGRFGGGGGCAHVRVVERDITVLLRLLEPEIPAAAAGLDCAELRGFEAHRRDEERAPQNYSARRRDFGEPRAADVVQIPVSAAALLPRHRLAFAQLRRCSAAAGHFVFHVSRRLHTLSISSRRWPSRRTCCPTCCSSRSFRT